MKGEAKVAVIIPALNEERGIRKVISAIPNWVDDLIVVDNGSTDSTAEVARSEGARVVFEPRRGYGSACLAGINALKRTHIVVFLDADFSDHPNEMERLIEPIVDGRAEMVIGSRVMGDRERGALSPLARWGNWFACLMIRLFWGVEYTDLGPFRAITYQGLKRLRMRDANYGWPVEMQIKAALKGLRGMEVPVSYRRRTGTSKISGTLKGVTFAGSKILYTIFKTAVLQSIRHGERK